MRIVLFALLASFAMTAAAAEKGAKDSEIRIVDSTWTVSLDAQGQVVKLDQVSAVKPVLSEPLARAIRGWIFEPGRVDGQPAPTQTTLYVSVSLEPQANDGYAVRVDKVRTGGGIEKTAELRFPSSVLSRGVDSFSVMVVVETRYDEAGKVMSAGIAAGSPEVERAVSDAALKSVRRWTFQPERVGGHAIASTAYVPICFSVMRDRRAPKRDCGTWTPPGLAGTDIGNGEAFALAPEATLKSDVIGRTL